MAEQNFNGIRVAILATDGFEQIELVPRKAWDSAGAKTTVIAPKGGTIYGTKRHDKAGTTKVDLELKPRKPKSFWWIHKGHDSTVVALEVFNS